MSGDRATCPGRWGAVVFDFDGTLAHLTIDFGEMRRRALAPIDEAGVDPTGLERLHVLEMVAEACLRAGPARGPGLAAACESAIRSVELAAAEGATLLPGAAEALADLRRSRIPVGVITRNCRAAVLRVAPDLLEQVGALLARGDCAALKPDPLHVRRCLEALGAEASPAVVIGDHPMDMETARAGGWRAIGVTTGAGTGEQLLAAGAARVFPGVREAVAFLTGGGPP